MNKDYYGGNIPWLKTGDLNDGTIIYIAISTLPLGFSRTDVSSKAL